MFLQLNEVLGGRGLVASVSSIEARAKPELAQTHRLRAAVQDDIKLANSFVVAAEKPLDTGGLIVV